MEFHEELAKASPPQDTALTIGVFDGVHLGHQHLLRHLKKLVHDKGLMAGVLTFRNHPRSVLNPEVRLRYVSPVAERVSLIKDQGIDLVVCIDFTREFSLTRAPDFVALLVKRLRMRGLLAGPGFALGHQREGDLPTLRRLGAEHGFWVEVVEPFSSDDAIISSSGIRKLISQGNVEKAGALLGRNHSLTGKVVEGDRRGRDLGFPTANLSVDEDIIIPGDGIYATWAIVDGRRFQAATNVGVRPTFGVSGRTIEAYILDFDEDIYGKQVTLEFVRRVRDEVAFPDVEALVAQMKLDVDTARVILSG